jgi:protein TonB
MYIGFQEYYFDTVLPPKQSQDVGPPETTKMSLIVDNASKADGAPKAESLKSPDNEPKKEEPKKEVPKKSADPPEAKQDTKPKDTATQKPPTKTENESNPKDKPFRI